MVILDTFGVAEIVPTINGGKEWFSTTFTDDPSRSFTNPGDPSWSPDTYDSDLFFRLTSATVSIASGEIAVNGQSPRIFIYGPWINTEFTAYVKRTGDSSSVKYAHLGSRSNHDVFDQNNNRCGFGRYNLKFNHYINRIACDKEVMHPMHIEDEQDAQDWTEGISDTEWAGLKTICRTDRENGTVRLEGWTDHTEAVGGGIWNKLTQWDDDGTVPYELAVPEDQVFIDDCFRTNDLNCPLWGGCKQLSTNLNKPFFETGDHCWIRTEEATSDVLYKWISVREIPPLT